MALSEIAADLALPEAAVLATARQLCARGRLRFDAEERVIGAAGLSVTPDAQRA